MHLFMAPRSPSPPEQTERAIGVALLLPQFGAHPVERKIHMVQHPRGMTVTITTQEGEVISPTSSHSSLLPGGQLGCILQGVPWGVPAGRPTAAGVLLQLGLAGGAAGGGCQSAAAAGAGVSPCRAPQHHLPSHRQGGPPLHHHLRETLGGMGEGHGDNRWAQSDFVSLQRSLGMRQQPVGSAQGEVLVVERVLHAAQGIPMVWHYSLLPSGYGAGLGRADLGVGTRMEELSVNALLQAFGSAGAGGVPGGCCAAGCTCGQRHGCRAPASLAKAAAGLGGGCPAVLLVLGQEGERGAW